jgi:tripartite-type tricarboxylate transporter receptor subunit TctC
MQQRRIVLKNAALAASLAAIGLQAAAQPQAKQDKAWPSQPLKIIVPFPPGGTSDMIARIIGNALGEALKTTVIVENKTGANGSVGAGVVAASTDSHTMLLSDMGAVALAHVITPELPYKTTDLQGVTMLAYSPHMLVATPSLPANNLQELIALSKRKKINVASSGTGAPTHLAMAEIAMATGMQWTHVPYRGGAQSIADTAAGVTDVVMNGMLATLPLVNAGRLKVIGISKRTRMALVGSMPTIAEQGLPTFESGTYQGVAVASAMPKAAVEKLGAALIAVIRAPEVRARLSAAGAEVMTSTPQEMNQFLVSERQRWSGVISRAGQQLEGTA